MRLKTILGYDFYDVSSALQKAIRRGDIPYAGYFALELFHSNYHDYLWRRLLTISAEDCAGIITQEIWALYEAFRFVRKAATAKPNTGRLFVSKAVIILCEALKSRDADHMGNFVYDKNVWIDNDTIVKYFQEVYEDNRYEIPDYAYDVHTIEGKRRGLTREDFFKTENEALTPKSKNCYLDEVLECLEKEY